MNYERTTVTCTDTDMTVGADIISLSDRRMEIVLDDTAIKLVLTKDTPHKPLYIGSMHGMEFTSNGRD